MLALGWAKRPYMDSSSLQASFALAPVPTAHVYSASYCGIVLMQGHDGLFARRLPIAFSCFSHLDIRGFCRRRFDRFAIVQVASQSWLRVVSLVEHAG